MKTGLQHTDTKNEGFTLVETVIVIALFALLSVLIGEIIGAFYRTNAYSIAQSAEIDTARRGMSSMVRDLREMTMADDGSFPLIVALPYSLSFYSDIDRDESVELITYSLSSTTLLKQIYNATGTPIAYSTSTPSETHILSEYVQNGTEATPLFIYSDKDGREQTATTSIADIRYVKIRLIVNIDPIRAPGEFLLESSSALRNLLSNP